MQKNKNRFYKISLAILWAASIFSLPASAIDFFLRPTNVSMVEDWSPQLSFFVSNPGERTIVLKVETRQTRTMLASTIPAVIALKALPAEIVLKAGERKIIKLDYSPADYRAFGHYEIVVEQLPVIYLRPGEDAMPETMLVTRYIAEVEVRRRKSQSQYAMTAFGRDFHKGLPEQTKPQN